MGHLHRSISDEFGTPPYIMDLVHKMLGVIDVDPASNIKANEIVKAKTFFSKENDGLTKDWHGKVWLNPPFSSPLVRKFCLKLIDGYDKGQVNEFIFLGLIAPSTKWQKPLLRSDLVWALSLRRETFLGPDGNWMFSKDGKPGYLRTPTCLVYGGPNRSRFVEIFGESYFIPNIK